MAAPPRPRLLPGPGQLIHVPPPVRHPQDRADALPRASAAPSLDTAEGRAHNSSSTRKTPQNSEVGARIEARRAAAHDALTAWLATVGDGHRTAPHPSEPGQRARRARDRARAENAPARRPARTAPVATDAPPTLPVELGTGPAERYLDPTAAGTFLDPVRALERKLQEARHQPADLLAQATPARRVGVLRARALSARASGSADVADALDERALAELRALQGRDHDRAWREWSRAEWLEHLERATRGTRAIRAAYWRQRGQERIAERLQRNGVPEAAAQTQAQNHPGTPWHAARARGAAARFEAVRECGLVSALVERCPGCGQRSELRLRCSDRFFCGHCRKAAGRTYRDQFRRQAAGLIHCAEREGLVFRRDRNRKAAAQARGFELLSERLITFTAPHLPGDTVAARIERIREAWRRMARVLADDTRRRFRGSLSLSTYEGQRSVRRRQLVQWLAVNEWTPGADNLGHPHVHVWHFGAFLDHAWLVAAWASCLLAADKAIARHAAGLREGGEDFRPIVDVRQVRAGFVDEVTGAGQRTGRRVKIEAEIYKYLTKDWADTEQNRRVDPEVYAQVYAAFLGRRMRQTSAGFADWRIKRHRECSCCGYEGRWQRGIMSLPVALGFDLRRDSWERPTPRPPPTLEELGRWPITDGAAREVAHARSWSERLDLGARCDLDRTAAELRAQLPARPAPLPAPLCEQLEIWGA
jgi:hypothetical protein